MKNGQALHTSPYVTQIEKYADSIKQLSRTFLHLEEKKSAFSNEEIEDMFDRTKERACKSCEKCSWCWEEDFVHTYQMGYEVLSAIDHYGSELNTETKRKLQQRCLRWEAFLQEMLGAYGYVCGYAPQYGERAGKKFIFGRASGKKAGISFKKERDSCTVQQFFPEQRRKI